MALSAVIAWLRHPFDGNDTQVEIARLTGRQILWMLLITAAVTGVLGVALAALDTPNLPWSILSVTTSFLAVYLTNLRSAWYACAYAANDLVLIVLWVLMSRQDPANITVAVNFGIFFINDCYGFISWRRRAVQQAEGRREG